MLKICLQLPVDTSKESHKKLASLIKRHLNHTNQDIKALANQVLLKWSK